MRRSCHGPGARSVTHRPAEHMNVCGMEADRNSYVHLDRQGSSFILQGVCRAWELTGWLGKSHNHSTAVASVWLAFPKRSGVPGTNLVRTYRCEVPPPILRSSVGSHRSSDASHFSGPMYEHASTAAACAAGRTEKECIPPECPHVV